MNAKLYLATQADLPAIVEIYNSTIASRQSTADLKMVTVDERQQWFDSHKDNRPLYVLKNANSEVIAWGSFSDYYPREAYKITAEISIYVSPNCRGKGIGKLMLSEMLKQAPKLNIRNVVAVIFGHNQASIKLFESFGFEHWGKLPAACDLMNFIADIVILGLPISLNKEQQ